MRKDLSTIPILFTFLLPFLLLLILSLQKSWVYPVILSSQWTTAHWGQFLTLGILSDSILYSVLISSCSACISTALGFILSRHVKFHMKFQTKEQLAFLPLLISPIVYSILLYYYFIFLGLTGKAVGIIIGQLIVLLPFSKLYFFGFWNQTVRNLEELSISLGANRANVVAHVWWPAGKPFILACFFQVFLFSWFDFAIANYIGVGKIPTLTVVVYRFITEANYFYAAVASVSLMAIPVTIVTSFNFLRLPLSPDPGRP